MTNERYNPAVEPIQKGRENLKSNKEERNN